MQMEDKPQIAEEIPAAEGRNDNETAKPEAQKQQKEKKSVGKEILSWIVTLGTAVVVALVIRTFLFEPVRVDGGSMLDTLQNGEIMFVTKPEYLFGQPQFGDVVICHFPGERNKGKQFVKRIVGVPGDEIEFRDGQLYRNGEGMDEHYLTPARNQDGYTMTSLKLGEDEYFVCGDNRDNSHDCRTLITWNPEPITREMIRGHVRTVVFPFSNWRNID